MGQAIPRVLHQACGRRSMSVLENSPMSCHFTTREEDLFKIDAVSVKCPATLLCQGVKGRLENIALIDVRSVVAIVSTLHA
jgi:hypothetical protein